MGKKKQAARQAPAHPSDLPRPKPQDLPRPGFHFVRREYDEDGNLKP